MKMKEIKFIKSVLSKEIGWSWPLFLIKCLIRKRSVFNNTYWANEKGAESKFAKRLSISAVIFLNLIEKMGKERAFEIMRKILVPTSCNEQWKNLSSLNISHKKSMDKLFAFYDFMGKGGVGQFVQRTLIKQDDNILHYEVRNCIFARFYKETGMPELTQLFCEVDKEFFPKAFPGIKFHRGDSWENTIAYGKDHCEFIFEKKDYK